MPEAFSLSFEKEPPLAKARQAWIDASQFHDLHDHHVFDEIFRRIRETGNSAQVILDLDSTLYEVGPRTLQIIQEWSASPEANAFSFVKEKLKDIQLQHVGYSLKDTFSTLGINLSAGEAHAAFQLLKPFWSKRFFSDDYLRYDQPYPGAAEFVQELDRMQAKIVYLTGRDEMGMGRGTREILKRDGFPVDPKRVDYFLKQRTDTDDHVHKLNAGHAIQKQGKVIASFENEPKNLVALHGILPDAMHVFVDTFASDHPAEPRQGLYRIKGFQRLR